MTTCSGRAVCLPPVGASLGGLDSMGNLPVKDPMGELKMDQKLFCVCMIFKLNFTFSDSFSAAPLKKIFSIYPKVIFSTLPMVYYISGPQPDDHVSL